MKKQVKLTILIAVAVLLGWGAWKAWRVYQAVKAIKENVPGVTINTDGFNIVKEDEDGNKVHIKVGKNGVVLAGNKGNLPIQVKVDADGVKLGSGENEVQIPLEVLKEQLKLMTGVKEESAE